MTAMANRTTAAATSPRRITLERTYRATIEEVWRMWTTAEGIEAWWGPDGFSVKVKKLDLRPGGDLHYDMTATAAPQIAFMRQAGMPLTTPARIRITEVVPPRRLAYVHLADFVPGVEPYEVSHLVELAETADGVHLRLTFDAMHADDWTERAVQGWTMELGKLERALPR